MELKTRVHIAVNVKSLEKGRMFYAELFNCDPNRVAHDQLDWIINEPPIHLSIFSNSKYAYGVEHVGFDMTSGALKDFKKRIGVSDIKTFDPDGLKIELYTSEVN